MDAVNGGIPDATAYFAEPVEAWHLISEERLDDVGRDFLGDDSPEERLHQYIVLSYSNIEDARAALEELRFRQGILNLQMDGVVDFSWTPNDPYFPINPSSASYYQWGLHTMNFPDAWEITPGHGYVGAIDGGVPSTMHPDLQQNFRTQFSFVETMIPALYEFHGLHVLGIIAATGDNGTGTIGGCPNCSVAMGETDTSASSVTESIRMFYRRGMQVVNLSLRVVSPTNCNSPSPICDAISEADQRDVLLVAAAGNLNVSQPDFPARHSSVLAVAGAENTNASNPNLSNWASWYFGPYGSDVYATNHAGSDGVTAPARSIVSSVPAGVQYIPAGPTPCSDNLPVDESGTSNDGAGSCTGTSMAAPHISALAGMLRSINPRLSRGTVQNVIRNNGTLAGSPTSLEGHGMVDAEAAAATLVSMTPNRLTPLFSQFSWGRRDFFFTTVPQMASTATWGGLHPTDYAGLPYRYFSAGGNAITGYGSYPSAYSEPSEDYTPKAAAWVFTTPENPKSAVVPLVPLYRLSWKCSDWTPSPPAICSTVLAHMDTTYTTDPAGIAAYESVGYKLDGIEGYIYPKSLSQPPGTEKLMRKYNPTRDDHAIFPESWLGYFTSLGYTQNSGSDWLGYAYPNTTGNVPPIL